MIFGRSEWAALRFNTPLTLSEADLSALRGLNEPITPAEVADIYLPLTRLLNPECTACARHGTHGRLRLLRLFDLPGR